MATAGLYWRTGAGRPMKRCCSDPKVKWASRAKRTIIRKSPEEGGAVLTILGAKIRAYVCQNCGKQDR